MMPVTELAIVTRVAGFNLFALGPPGAGKETAIRLSLSRLGAGPRPVSTIGRDGPMPRLIMHRTHDPHLYALLLLLVLVALLLLLKGDTAQVLPALAG
jgi:hypothetical protein